MEKTRRSIIVFLIMISIMIQRYFVVHLHNDFINGKKINKSKSKPLSLFVSCFPPPRHHIPSPAWLHSPAVWWSHWLEGPRIVGYAPVRKKHKQNHVVMKSCKVELMNALFHFKKATLALSWCSVGGRLTAVSQTMVTFNNPPVNAKVLR